jgi:hopene-associated glycosyltransferase HpnB
MLSAATVVSLLALLAWLYLLAGHGGFWRTDQRLPPGTDGWAPCGGARPGGPRSWPSVAAVVPARDEAAMLGETLPSLLDQDYPGPFAVVLVDDQSADGTASVARGLGAGARHPLTVVDGSPPPEGWAGKVWAMAQGAEAAIAAPGHADNRGRPVNPADPDPPAYLLFTDADVAHARGSVTALVRAAEGDRRDLVSRMALLRARTGWERAIVPAFVYFFAMLYPFRRVNRAGSRTAAAAGGCMLVRRRTLEEAGGLGRICHAPIDDVALGRLLGRAGGRLWLGLATEVRSRRPYPRLADLWSMIARSAYTQLRYSPALLVGTVAGLALLFLVPPLAAASGLALLAAGTDEPGKVALLAWSGLATWAIMAATYVPMLRLYRLSPFRAPSLPLLATLYAAMTVDSARRHRGGAGAAWKGRMLPRRDPGA